jgi:hypothetical protein
MIEEFAALMNHSDLRYVLFPPKCRNALDILDEHLGVPYSLGRTWLKDGVNLRVLVEYFKDKRDNEHFLVGDFEALDRKIIDIVDMLGTDNLVPMILAKTLNGLDDLKDGIFHHFKGSPLLLQVVSLTLYFRTHLLNLLFAATVEYSSSFFLFFFLANVTV